MQYNDFKEVHDCKKEHKVKYRMFNTDKQYEPHEDWISLQRLSPTLFKPSKTKTSKSFLTPL